MKIAVCVKHVPATDTKIQIEPSGRDIVRAGINWVISPYDEFAIEEAVRLKEKAGSGDVTVFSMAADDGPKESLRKALAMGADNAVLLKDTAFADSDPLATARVLAKALAGGGYELIFCGQQGAGLDQSQVGPILAEKLGLPHVNLVVKLEVAGGAVTAEREIEGGHEVVACPTPAVIVAQKGLNEPRYPSLKGIMAAKKKTIEEKGLAVLGLKETETGAAGSGTRIAKMELPPAKQPGKMIAGDPAQAARELTRILHQERKLF
jgi:electron transfer flavoprotein beta subunit